MTTLEKFLRIFYTNSSQHGQTSEWPPTLKVEFVNLELIQQTVTKAPRRTDLVKVTKLSKRGEISTILKQSTRIAIKDITNYTSPRKVIIIEGAPGIGKSTLAFKLCQDWANHKLLTEFSLVLYLPLRVPLVRIVEKVDDLQTYFGEQCTPTDIQFIKQTLGHRVLFVLDGWDELRPSCRLPDSFFPKLIRGEILPECSIIVTSRPSAIDENIKRHSANRLIEILGFTEEQVKQYIYSYFKDDEGAAQKLIKDLEAYPNVASTCYVAVNLTIVCYVYWASELQLPSTLTEVYKQFVLHTVKRHFKIKVDDTEHTTDVESLDCVQMLSDFGDSVNRTLQGLGQLALEGLEYGDLSFNKKKLTSACHVDEPEGFDGFGLLKVVFVYHVYGPERTYDFLHLTVQEYLAAYAVFQMEASKQRAWLDANLRNETYEMVLKFFCGMDQFKSHQARVIFSNKRSIGAPFIPECIFEGQWEEGCQTIAENTHSTLIITSNTYLQPYRALVYGYVMTKSRTQWQLEWHGCTLGEHELKSMSGYLLYSPTTLKQISMIQCSLKAPELLSEVIRSQTELSELTFSRTRLDDSCLNSICKALDRHQTLKTLRLSHNELSEGSSEAVTSLLITLPSVQNIDLSGNPLGEDGCTSILLAVYSKSSLQELHLPHKSDNLLQKVKEQNADRKDKGLNEFVVYFP